MYFHPGGYYSSSGQSLIEGPQYLMDQDIVLVVANYRLASLGKTSEGENNSEVSTKRVNIGTGKL